MIIECRQLRAFSDLINLHCIVRTEPLNNLYMLINVSHSMPRQVVALAALPVHCHLVGSLIGGTARGAKTNIHTRVLECIKCITIRGQLHVFSLDRVFALLYSRNCMYMGTMRGEARVTDFYGNGFNK